MHVSLIGLPFLGVMSVLAVAAAAACWPVRRRRALRWVAWAATAVLLPATAAVAVNDYFDYLPTVGAALGRRARDEASPRDIARRAQVGAPLGMRRTAYQRGMVEQVAIPGVRSGFRARRAQVYLPPAWFAPSRPRLPVIELLHGTPGTPEDWTRAGLVDVVADTWAAGHRGRAPIIVMPDVNGSFLADTECVDGIHGRAETYLAVDVPRWVTAHLHPAGDRNHWAIAGNSEGGYCALDLGLRHADRFATLADFSGMDRPTYGGDARKLWRGSQAGFDAHDPRWLLAGGYPRRPLAAWFEVGSSDGADTASARAMAALFRRHHLPAVLVVQPNGHHTWRVWRHAFRDAFPWVVHRLGLDPVPAAVTDHRG